MEVFNISYDNEINHRITQRNQNYVATNIHLGVRPLSTKYDYKPILDKPVSNNVKIKKYPVFNVRQSFLPGDRQGPWDGFSTHIQDESKLRNMYFSNNDCMQRFYIPSSKSSLYVTPPIPNNNPVKQTHPMLFAPNKHYTTTTKYAYKENKVFNNDSRQTILNHKIQF